MIGCRPLTQTEIDSILETLKTPRDKALFTLGLFTGFRITESLSIRWIDILNADKSFKERVKVSRSNTKGSFQSRTVLMHPEVKRHLKVLYESVQDLDGFSYDWYTFRSNKGANRPISRKQAHRTLSIAVKTLGLEGAVSLHSTRKTFASRVHARLGRDLLKTAKALGHKNVSSTVSYLSFDTKELDEAILNIGDEE